jgi:Na+-translocating ferredoxin:NAD+ oxidoreductase RnfC subunit
LEILTRVAEDGVVGAGGGGFPAAIKLRSPAETLIVNGAECEPLLHKDKELMLHRTHALLSGIRGAMKAVGAGDGVIGVKAKYQEVFDHLTPRLGDGLRLRALSDTYPAGDEFILVHDVTGRVIPPGGLPKDVGAVVFNVETLVNIGLDRPVTHKYLTVAGAVASPMTLCAPIGLSFADAISAAGGPTESEVEVLVGGVMMARLAGSLEEPITKTTGGLVVLPRNHRLVARYGTPRAAIERINRSACDQCRFCTELCPRHLLGHPIEPHKAMLASGFAREPDPLIAGVLSCCECNLCTLFACPEDLDPRSACVFAKPLAREKGLTWKGRPEDVTPHGLMPARRVPTRRLKCKLGLDAFRDVGPLVDQIPQPKRVVLPLKQHAGEPARPVVDRGTRISAGQVVAAPSAGAQGAPIHASLSGIVKDTENAIVVEV